MIILYIAKLFILQDKKEYFFKEYLNNHDFNYVLDLLIRNNLITFDLLKYMSDYYNNPIISVNNAKRLVDKKFLNMYKLPEYMYKSNEYLEKIFYQRSYNYSEKYQIVDVLIRYDVLNETMINNILGRSEIEDSYNPKLYSEEKYTKVLAHLNSSNGYHFKSSGITNEVVDILFEKGIKYISKYSDKYK